MEATGIDSVRYLGVWVDGQRCPVLVRTVDDVDSVQLTGTLVFADGAAAAKMRVERDDGLTWGAKWTLPRGTEAAAANAGITGNGPVNFFGTTIALAGATQSLQLRANHPVLGSVTLCRFVIGAAPPEGS
jgi:hypothetical protein